MLGNYNMDVNKRVKELRKENRYTQEKIAEMLAMKTSTYSQMERSGKIPIHIIMQLAEIFKVEISEILYGKKEDDTQAPQVDETFIADDPQNGTIGVKTPTSPIEESYDKITLSNREENLVIMIRNLYPADKEEIYRMVKVFHDKKHKKN